MKLFSTLTFLLMTSLCFAQRQNVYFLKNNGTKVQVRDSADFIRIVREPDSGSVNFNVFEYYPDGAAKTIGKSSTIDPLTFEEQCVRYFKNGNKKTVSSYKKGALVNSEYAYFPNGKLYLTKEFPDNGNIYLVTDCRDSTGTELVVNGNGHYIGYDDAFKKITEEGEIKNGKREGTWKGRDDGVHLRFEENYANGILITGMAIPDSGKTVNYSKSRTVLPQFRGGVEGFSRYLSNHIHYPDIARQYNIQGRVVLSFVVEKDGQLTDIKITRPVAKVLDEEAVRVLTLSPKWIAGTMYGLPVRVQYSVPISFALN